MKTIAPYGSWRSPVSAAMIAGETIGLDQPRLDGDNSYWIEKRPTEAGRQVIVRRRSDGQVSDLIAAPFSARSRVHEYGGGAYTVSADRVYFVNDSDQGIYYAVADDAPQLLYMAPHWRFADLHVDTARQRLYCIGEDHNPVDGPENSLVAVSLSGTKQCLPLHRGYDFYASPALSPDGARLAWLAWRHPNMPWDGTELLLAELDAGGNLKGTRVIAGGEAESVFQPRWSPDGRLYFVSDRNGWWNLYRYDEDDTVLLCDFEAEFGLPQWVFGMSTYAFQSAERIVCACCQYGEWSLASICTATGELQRIDTPWRDLGGIQANATRVLLLGGSPTQTIELAEISLPGLSRNTLRQSSQAVLPPADISVPEAVRYPTTGGANAYGFFYAPTNAAFRGPMHQRPPVIVVIHGGPTAATGSTLSYKVQFWTSRGFAVLDVNYRGSTGFGRAYRESLDGLWGVVDVADCEAGVRYLAGRGVIDPDRAIIRGSSAGGYTTLCALTFGDTFKAGASLYGISDLETLVRDTHKFESRYLDRLIGPWPAQQARYRQRSPIHVADRLDCPVIFLQGLEDKVVPPSQAETMVAALRNKGVAVSYITFEGEQHGFRQADSIRRALEAELYFYSRIFDFVPADALAPVAIDNLDT